MFDYIDDTLDSIIWDRIDGRGSRYDGALDQATLDALGDRVWEGVDYDDLRDLIDEDDDFLALEATPTPRPIFQPDTTALDDIPF